MDESRASKVLRDASGESRLSADAQVPGPSGARVRVSWPDPETGGDVLRTEESRGFGVSTVAFAMPEAVAFG
ncbi:hypothetical protein GCM10022254_59840 [Actinomadura meridiana]|uniref:Uncharacterized protein n=1 Tax=Actinomadura meridiana TaxID=559626 RepID=A0ABP8CHW1_9ACTN